MPDDAISIDVEELMKDFNRFNDTITRLMWQHVEHKIPSNYYDLMYGADSVLFSFFRCRRRRLHNEEENKNKAKNTEETNRENWIAIDKPHE